MRTPSIWRSPRYGPRQRSPIRTSRASREATPTPPYEIADRDAALGAIETHFYDQRRIAHQSRQTGGRSAGG